MENKNDEKTCENCRFFLAHYIKRDTSYFNIRSGHCTNSNYRNRRKKREPELCEFWEDIAIKKEARKKSIKQTLEFMSECISEITMILKDDSE